LGFQDTRHGLTGAEHPHHVDEAMRRDGIRRTGYTARMMSRAPFAGGISFLCGVQRRRERPGVSEYRSKAI
jgi:hypothetical protein